LVLKKFGNLKQHFKQKHLSQFTWTSFMKCVILRADAQVPHFYSAFIDTCKYSGGPWRPCHIIHSFL